MITLSDRNIFVGAHVTQAVKNALLVLARLTGKSMSAVIAEAVEEKIQKEHQT